jgi:hypothetical protein
MEDSPVVNWIKPFTIPYFYNVGTVTDGVHGGGMTNHFMVTEPLVGSSTPFRAWIFGDSGNDSADQRAVRDAMLLETLLNPPNIIFCMPGVLG